MACSCSQNQSAGRIPPDALEMTKKHPCFSFAAHRRHARMHLPVAPRCNISCNYCNRLFDCLHESRPGVTSEILSPEAARQKYRLVKEKIENLSVVGIAGPGDALANWEESGRTVQLIREEDPEAVFCLSTNGLMLPDYGPEIVELGIRHVTVTVNCLDPETGSKIYKFVNYKGKRYVGSHGAAILLQNQLAGIEFLVGEGVVVKVNIVMIPGINDRRIPAIVRKMKDMGVYITNIMPLIPARGSAFEHLPQTSMKDVNQMRTICQADLQQMFHCRQCRADAIGLLDDDRSLEFRSGREEQTAAGTEGEGGKRQYRIAVAPASGTAIDLHFGHAPEFR